MHDFLETAKLAVQLEADTIRTAFSATKTITEKADSSLVTETDRSVEQSIRAYIQSRHPNHEILGEEHGSTGQPKTYHWTIDPIDGTTNFTRGIPWFTTAVALLKGAELVAAAAYQPMTDELFTAGQGRGATLNDAPLRLGHPAVVEQAIVVFGRTRRQKPAFLRAFAHLHGLIGTPRIVGSIIVGHCLVAAGRIDASVVLSPNLWDLAPGVLIAQEAGAIAVDFSGQPWTTQSEELLLAHPNLAQELVTLFGSKE